MAKKKFYVVWNGVRPGIYDNWDTCKTQVMGYENAKYKAFDSMEAAQDAYRNGYTAPAPGIKKTPASPSAATFIRHSIAVDAACSGNPGNMEYRGVYVATGQQLFHVGPYRQGTNNIGEFLALVHGLAWMKRENMDLPLYSDSRNAISWIQQKLCKTKLEQTAANLPIFDLIERAEKWLKENTYTTRILKWDTAAWGEIPADFGRK
ncbi:MAG: ribonuclease H family protein [Tannerella sp.]|nr:ribonuclease H family protein [Tannerella sp.]